MTTIVCVKWGDKYHSSEVNKLFSDIKEYRADVKFLCYTDDASGLSDWIDIQPICDDDNVDGFWNKAMLFNNSVSKFNDRKMILLDIDMVLLNDPSPIIDFKPAHNTVHLIYAYWKNDVVFGENPNNPSNAWDMDANSSCAVWYPSVYIGNVTRKFISADPDIIMLSYKGFDRYVYYNHANVIGRLPSTWFYSLKYGGRPDSAIFRMLNGTRK